MPMDYDDNDFQSQNLHLAGEGSSTVSPVLRSYALPKFDFDDSLQGHLRFDSLVENEVFLGITSQEDNQWIEEYSRGSSGIEFSSNAAESRRNNVWSEATSSESVEMLLKSVGQEERVVGETITENLDASDEPGSVATIMNPNLNDERIIPNELPENFSGSNASSECEKPHIRFTSQSHDAQISGGELDSVVLGEKRTLSVEKKFDRIHDVKHEAENLANECGDIDSQQNFNASNADDLAKNSSSNEGEDSIKSKETSVDNPIGRHTIGKTENPSVVSNVESVDKLSFEVSIPVNEESTSLMPIENSNLLMTEGADCVKRQTIEDEDRKLEILGSSESNVSSPSKVSFEVSIPVNEESTSLMPIESSNLLMTEGADYVKRQTIEDEDRKLEILGSSESNVSSPSKVSCVESRSFEEAKNAFKVSAGKDPSELGGGSSVNDVGPSFITVCSSAELLAGHVLNENVLVSSKSHIGDSNDEDQCLTAKLSDSVQVNDEIQSSEPVAVCMDKDVTTNERRDARSPDEVVGALNSQKNVESSSSAEGGKEIIEMAQGSGADTTILAEPVTAVDTPDGVSVATDDIATKSPILGVSLMHHDHEKKTELGFPSEGSSQNGAPQAVSMVDYSSEGPLSVVEKGTSPDHAGNIVPGNGGHSAPRVETIKASSSQQAADANPDGLRCSMTSETSDPSTKVSDNVEAGGLHDLKESTTGHHRAAPLSLAGEVLLEKAPLLETSCVELSQSAKDTPEVSPKKAPLLEGKMQLVPSSSDKEGDKNFTFEVNASAGLGQTEKGLQSTPSIQKCNLPTIMEGPSIDSSSTILSPGKSHDVSIASPQTHSSATIQVEVKGNPERKTRRKSAGKESAKKGNRQKETTPRQSGRVEKSSALVTPPATGRVIHFEEPKSKENVDSSIAKTSSVLPVSTSTLPDLNNSSSIFQQPFTDNQQVQLRAQILVYGSLISGTPPEEPHMIAAFGQSDGGRKAWEATWRERVHGQKSQANNPETPMQSRSGHRTPDPGTKHASVPSKIFSSPVGGTSNKGTPSPVVSPLIPLSSPLWNMSTPSVGFPSSGIPRTFLHDYHQSLSPLHPYQTSAVQNFTGHNPPWLSQGPFGGQWVASSPVSAFNVGARFSALPITEAVKLTPVKVSGTSGIKHANPIPVVNSAGTSLFRESSPLSDAKKATMSSGQASGDSKNRKRKKGIAVPAPLVAHLPQVPRIEDHGQIPLLTQNLTDSITAPVVSSIFSTSVTVSTPATITSKSSPGMFLSASSTHDHPRFADKKAENVMISETLSKVEESKVHAEVKTTQSSSVSKSTKRKKFTASAAINQTSVPKQGPVVAYMPQVPLVAENQADSVIAPVVNSLFSMPTVYSASTHDYPRAGYQNIEKAVVTEETLSKVEESKLQAENAATHAAAEVDRCQSVWSQLEQQKSSGVVSDNEAKLTTSVISVAAAASVAKMAAAAAKIASNVAEQARLMADEVLLSSRTKNFDQSSMISHPNSIISAAREAARRRIEAASAASKHAENLDAIVKAAELAAEAVSQAGKIVSMGDPSALRKLVDAGPQGFWKTYDQQGEVSRHLNSNSDKKKVEATPNVSVGDIQTLNYGLTPQRDSRHLAENQMTVIGGISGSVAGHEKEKRAPRSHKGPDLSKAVGTTPETDIGLLRNYAVGQNVTQSTSGPWHEHNIKEGCLVEVYKDNNKYKGAWFAANVLSLKDEKALVCYTEIQSDEGSEKLKEWVPLRVEGTEAPRIRIAHPMTTMRFEGTRKRRRTAVTDYAWSNGDLVDVWMQDCWREGLVTEPNSIDASSLTVQFPEGETSVVRSWYVRPTLTWKDEKWIQWSNLKGDRSSECEKPKEKRAKHGSPSVKEKTDKIPENVDILESGRLEESRKLPLSAEESSFNVGQNSKDEKKLNTVRMMRSGLQKEGPRVIFGVPKPGKKQKFMEVSKHYDGSDKNNTTNDSIKFARYLKPRAPGPQGWKINSRNDAREKQLAETKPRVKPRKPPVPTFRVLAQKDNNSVSSKSTTHEAEMPNKSDRNLVGDVENQMEFGSSSNMEDATKGPAVADVLKKGLGFTSNAKSERLNKGKLAPAGGKTGKIEVKDKSIPEVMEPRRSNRRIQPTSRLLEGLQSSLTISKIPSVSHGSQRSHNKVTSKGGNTNHG